ncbi:MAG: MmcQ/YjbR family DNA-binding protein, partial [Actinomycetales bacterium]|nr:MmcQ/YjbR family DNA-binding protein [Actinomycetales bacterium]
MSGQCCRSGESSRWRTGPVCRLEGPTEGGIVADRISEFALAMPGAWPDEPWDGDRVAKVGPDGAGKIFAFLGIGSVGVKCGTRDEADEWLERYPDDASVMAYIGRSGWNTLRRDGAI